MPVTSSGLTACPVGISGPFETDIPSILFVEGSGSFENPSLPKCVATPFA